MIMIKRIKHNFLAHALLCAALLLSGCEREQAPAWEKPAELTARIEGADPGTKTSYDSEGAVGTFVWNDGDEIAIHYNDGAYATHAVAPTTGAVNAPSTAQRYRDYYAVYPATAAVAGNYGNPTLQVSLPDSYDISGTVATTLGEEYSPCPMVAVNDVDSDVLEF